MTPKKFTYLYSTEYEHPFDKDALDRLEKTRGLDLLSKKVLNSGLEKYLFMRHTGDNIRVTASNIPELYNILEKACEILAMDVVPELYIHLDDKIKSMTIGEKRRVIVLSSGAIDLLNNDELLFMLGRELGHIKSNHVLYHMMANSLRAVSQVISDISLGIGNLISMPLQIALLHWHRMSEFTADRAGLLTCQNIDVAARTLIKIAGLPLKYHGKISVNDFREQAHTFDDIEESTFDKFIRFAASHDSHQPFTVIRASQLFQWFDKGVYEEVLNRTREPGSMSNFGCTNRKCPFPFEADELFCRECGTKLVRNKNNQTMLE